MKTSLSAGFAIALASSLLRADEPAQTSLFAIIRKGDPAALRTALKSNGAVSARDAVGNTPLHLAALGGETAAVAALLEAGAPVNATNQAGATPLLYGAHDERIVRDLLKSGANPNLASTLGSTPLMAAVMRPDSYATVRVLVEHGADVKARRSWDAPGLGGGEQALAWAMASGDRRTIDFLISQGASLNPTNSFSPIESAALYGDLATIRKLLDLGANPNQIASLGGVGNKAGPALNTSLFGDHRDVALLLIERGADLRQTSPIGHGTTPAVFSAYSEWGDDTVARALRAKGIDLNTGNDTGETAWSYTLKRGLNSPLALWLQEVGATNGSPPARAKVVPHRSIPAEHAARVAMIREQSQRAIRALEISSTVFVESGLPQKQGKCVSCHQQSLPEMAMGLARERGLQIDPDDVVRMLASHAANWRTSAEAARQLLEPQPDSANNLGWGLQGLHALGYTPDDMTEAMVHYLLLTQQADGSWRIYDRRPPIQDSALVGTALAARGVQLYPIPGREKEAAEALSKARLWLVQSRPQTHNERVFQLLGLRWTGELPANLGPQLKAVLADQRADGGWAQLPGRDCDAWATGQTLVALHQAGDLPASHPAYQRGVEFLLRTQFEDGSWWVKSRSWPFQPHFDSQFPHGKDQWISAAGTAWATMALLLTLEPSAAPGALPSAQQLIASAASQRTTSTSGSDDPKAAPVLATIDFDREIRPIFERSCLTCHSGERPKGSFNLSTRELALKGGESGAADILPGRPEGSALLRFVQDQVEDLEMPPLPRRSKYPALTREEIGKVSGWISQGAAWPRGVALQAAGK